MGLVEGASNKERSGKLELARVETHLEVLLSALNARYSSIKSVE